MSREKAAQNQRGGHMTLVTIHFVGQTQPLNRCSIVAHHGRMGGGARPGLNPNLHFQTKIKFLLISPDKTEMHLQTPP